MPGALGAPTRARLWSSKAHSEGRPFPGPATPLGQGSIDDTRPGFGCPHRGGRDTAGLDKGLSLPLHSPTPLPPYVNNLNAALAKFPELASLGIIDLNKAAGSATVPDAISKAVINQGGGVLNHSLFWKVMTGPTDSNGPSPALKGAIEASFGSMDEFKTAFNAAAAGVFGSGWAWLVLKPDGKLAVTSSPNQANPLMTAVVGSEGAGIPLLGLDVWEHAYYLKYQNKRPEYIAAWWNVVNWERVSEAYEAGQKGEVLL